MTQIQLIALIIFCITYIGIIFTRLPWVNIDRPSAAFFGAVAMILTGVLSFQEAVYAVDYNTIALLLGMMIIITTLQLDGFFSLIAHQTLTFAKTPLKLLTIIVFVTGIASAFMVNDAVVLLFTPVVIAVCSKFKLNPVPYLIAEILASNTGSAMTITGNPQTMLIGINSGIDYGRYLLLLLPVSVIGMLIIVMAMHFMYPSEFRFRELKLSHKNEFAYNTHSMRISVPVFLLVVAAFFFSRLLHLSIPLIALAGGSLILLFGKIKPSKLIREIDWVLLLFFASLFIVVRGVEKQGFMNQMIQHQPLHSGLAGITGIHVLSLIASQIVSNVPFSVAMLPYMKSLNSETLWLSLASAATLAGNATIIGAMANLIVIESAESKGIRIKFFEFFKIGIITTLLSFVLSIGVIYLESLAGWIK